MLLLCAGHMILACLLNFPCKNIRKFYFFFCFRKNNLSEASVDYHKHFLVAFDYIVSFEKSIRSVNLFEKQLQLYFKAS